MPAEKIRGLSPKGKRWEIQRRLLKALEPGDTIIVTGLDRLARSTLDLLNTVDAITKAGAQFRPSPIPGVIPPRVTAS
jgi:DNA invertase Pin-like site-specific DNA recombinase